jgi:hypothetical protein
MEQIRKIFHAAVLTEEILDSSNDGVWTPWLIITSVGVEVHVTVKSFTTHMAKYQLALVGVVDVDELCICFLKIRVYAVVAIAEERIRWIQAYKQ